MTKEELIRCLTAGPDPNNRLFPFTLSASLQLSVYPRSVQRLENSFLFVGRESYDKHLWLVALDGGLSLPDAFEGTVIESEGIPTSVVLKECPLIHHNANVIRRLFPFTKATLLGLQNSIGCGDRLGLANPAHLRAIAGSGFKPVLAQQSVRELERTNREAEDVMDAATWAVFQEGYHDGFGADADHLKTPEDIDRYAKAGFTMFTLDIGAYVVNEAARLPIEEIRARAATLPWDILNDTLNPMVNRYASRRFSFDDSFEIAAETDEVLRALVKYGLAIAQTAKLCNHLKTKWSGLRYEIELSVDETDTPTSPLEHFIIGNELKRLGVKLVSLAPRFVGDFEKGIDYKGDLDMFRSEYVRHLKIAEKVGPYKISVHSGSDKFKIYSVIGSLGMGRVHVKTAGTSYLEALRTIAVADPGLFREILDCARSHFDTDRKSYHVTAEVAKLRPTKDYTEDELRALLSEDNARQILHVTFGTVLSKKNDNGGYVFKDRIIGCLEEHEDIHYRHIIDHFRRHIDPLRQLVQASKGWSENRRKEN